MDLSFSDLNNALQSYPTAPLTSYPMPSYDNSWVEPLIKQINDIGIEKRKQKAADSAAKNAYLEQQRQKEYYDLTQQKAGDIGVSNIYNQMKQGNVPYGRLQDFITGYSTNNIEATKFVGGLGSVDPDAIKEIKKQYSGPMDAATASKIQALQAGEGKLRETSAEEIKKKDTIAGILAETKGLENTISVLQKQLDNPYATPQEKKDITSQLISANNEYEKKMNSIGNVYMGRDINYTTELPSPTDTSGEDKVKKEGYGLGDLYKDVTSFAPKDIPAALNTKGVKDLQNTYGYITKWENLPGIQKATEETVRSMKDIPISRYIFPGVVGSDLGKKYREELQRQMGIKYKS